ncbi:MAG: site-2 protease family protein [Planctomycetota bacterium]
MRQDRSKNTAARSGWTLRLGRFLGIDVFVHVTLLLLLGVLAAVQLVGGGPPAAAAWTVLSLGAVFSFVLLHEYGHALAARRYGIATRDITLLPIGGVAQLERMPERPREELVVALAGPAVNLALALLAAVGLAATLVPGVPAVAALRGALAFALLSNGLLFAFNLLPALPMDGGRVLRALLAMRLGSLRATELAARVGRLFAVGLGVIGLFANPVLILIAAFVWFGAAQETYFARARAGLQGASVASAMATDILTLSPTDRLSDVAELARHGSQRHYPVVHDGALVGVLHDRDLLRALGEERFSSVASVMRAELEAARPADDLLVVFTRLAQTPYGALPVVEGTRLVGLITRDGLQRFLALRGLAGPTTA